MARSYDHAFAQESGLSDNFDDLIGEVEVEDETVSSVMNK